MKTFAMMVLGCKVNDYEATYLKTKLLEEYKEVSFKDKADIYVIFTCCVTNMAEAKTRKMLHRARKQNKDAYIVAIGCLAQIKGHTDDFNVCDLIIGSKYKDKAFDLIKANYKGCVVEGLENVCFENLYLNRYPGKSRSFLKIQDGCNQYCSYCIIPYARGHERSANHLTILKQAQELSKYNKELVLTGIHTGRYNDGEYNLYDLLKDLLKIDELKTIRLSSIEITELTDEIIDLIKSSNDRIAHHLHIPVQSCSNKILKLMNRPYSIEDFIKRIEYIRNEIPDISISTDLIVGFPNETEEDFLETLSNLNIISFSFVHVFPYARKNGTKADGLTGHLNNDVKKDRVDRVISNQKILTYNFNSKFINKQLDMLIEKCDESFSYGYVKQYIYVKIDGNYEIGSIVKVSIDKIDEEGVYGHAIK